MIMLVVFYKHKILPLVLAIKDMQVMVFIALRKKWEFLGQEHIGRKLIASVLLLINEVELLIYRFLSSGAKNSKR